MTLIKRITHYKIAHTYKTHKHTHTYTYTHTHTHTLTHAHTGHIVPHMHQFYINKHIVICVMSIHFTIVTRRPKSRPKLGQSPSQNQTKAEVVNVEEMRLNS